MPKITGIFTPHIVPLDGGGRINEAELRRYVDWLIAQGVHGLYPNGSTGEFTRFTPEERRRIIQIVCDQAAGRVPAAGRRRRGQRPRDDPRLRDVCRLRRSGGGHRVAVLLQALPGVGLRLLPRDRPATARST